MDIQNSSKTAPIKCRGIKKLPTSLLSMVLHNLNVHEVLVYQRVSKEFKSAVNESLPEITARYIPKEVTESLSNNLLKNTVINFLKSKQVELADFRFWIEYAPSNGERKVVPITRCSDNPAATPVWKVPPPEKKLPFSSLSGNYDIHLWAQLRKRFNVRIKASKLEVGSEFHAVGALFPSRVAWLQPANLIFEDLEGGENAIEKWGDNYLLKVMLMHGSVNDPEFTGVNPETALRILAKWFEDTRQNRPLFGSFPF